MVFVNLRQLTKSIWLCIQFVRLRKLDVFVLTRRDSKKTRKMHLLNRHYFGFYYNTKRILSVAL